MGRALVGPPRLFLGQALVGPLGHLWPRPFWAGPFWAPLGRGPPLGHCGLRPYGPLGPYGPGRALVGPCSLIGRAPMGSLG